MDVEKINPDERVPYPVKPRVVLVFDTDIELKQRMDAFLKKCGLDSIGVLLETSVINFMDNWPWNEGCIHSDECCHWEG